MNHVNIYIVDYNSIESTVWVENKRVADEANNNDVSTTLEVIRKTLEAANCAQSTHHVVFNNTDALASPFRVADSNGNDTEYDIAIFSEAVTIAVKSGVGYEVINRFGNSVYRAEEE